MEVESNSEEKTEKVTSLNDVVMEVQEDQTVKEASSETKDPTEELTASSPPVAVAMETDEVISPSGAVTTRGSADDSNR